MNPRPFSWDRLLWMNRQWKGIVFMDFRDENAPRFILNLIEELQREGIAESISPCQTFAKSFMMISPATKRRDLALLLRPMDENTMSILENWRNNQGEQIVLWLPDYVKQYAPEFTGILPVPQKDDMSEDEAKTEEPHRKSKKHRSKKNKHADSGTDDNQPQPPTEPEQEGDFNPDSV